MPAPKFSMGSFSFYKAYKESQLESQVIKISKDKHKQKHIDNIIKLIKIKEFDPYLKIQDQLIIQFLAENYNESRPHIKQILEELLVQKTLDNNNLFFLFERIISNKSHLLFTELSSYLMDPNLTSPDKSISLIHVASFNGHQTAINHLIEMKADLNVTDINGMTPLILSIVNGYGDIAKQLLESGCLAITKDNSGHIASMYCIQKENYDILDLLIINGAHETKDIPLLNNAIMNNNMKIIKILLNKKYNKYIDVNKKSSKDGLSPLQYSILLNNYEMFKYLFQYSNTDKMTKDIYNNNILHNAASSSNLNIVFDICESKYGNDLKRQKNKDDLYPMDIAKSKWKGGNTNTFNLNTIYEKVKFHE